MHKFFKELERKRELALVRQPLFNEIEHLMSGVKLQSQPAHRSGKVDTDFMVDWYPPAIVISAWEAEIEDIIENILSVLRWAYGCDFKMSQYIDDPSFKWYFTTWIKGFKVTIQAIHPQCEVVECEVTKIVKKCKEHSYV